MQICVREASKTILKMGPYSTSGHTVQGENKNHSVIPLRIIWNLFSWYHKISWLYIMLRWSAHVTWEHLESEISLRIFITVCISLFSLKNSLLMYRHKWSHPKNVETTNFGVMKWFLDVNGHINTTPNHYKTDGPGLNYFSYKGASPNNAEIIQWVKTTQNNLNVQNALLLYLE